MIQEKVAPGVQVDSPSGVCFLGVDTTYIMFVFTPSQERAEEKNRHPACGIPHQMKLFATCQETNLDRNGGGGHCVRISAHGRNTRTKCARDVHFVVSNSMVWA